MKKIIEPEQLRLLPVRSHHFDTMSSTVMARLRRGSMRFLVHGDAELSNGCVPETLDRYLLPGLHFRTSNVTVRFLLGCWYAYAPAFPGCVSKEHFSNLPEHPPSSAELPTLEPTAEVLFVPFHPIRKRLPTVELAPKTIRYVPAQYKLYYVTIQGSFAEYLRKFSTKSRHELRRTAGKFMRSCGNSSCFREYQSVSEIAQFYKLACEVSQRTLRGKCGSGIPQTAEYYSELLAAAQEGSIRGYLLFQGDRPVAFDLCRVKGDSLAGEIRGFDPQYRQLSPGRVLTFCILNRLFDQHSFQKWDFGPGEAEYKAVFSTAHQMCADIYYFRRNFKNTSLILAHWGVRAMSWGAGKMLDMAHLRKKLIRVLEKHLA